MYRSLIAPQEGTRRLRCLCVCVIKEAEQVLAWAVSSQTQLRFDDGDNALLQIVKRGIIEWSLLPPT